MTCKCHSWWVRSQRKIFWVSLFTKLYNFTSGSPFCTACWFFYRGFPSLPRQAPEVVSHLCCPALNSNNRNRYQPVSLTLEQTVAQLTTDTLQQVKAHSASSSTLPAWNIKKGQPNPGCILLTQRSYFSGVLEGVADILPLKFWFMAQSLHQTDASPSWCLCGTAWQSRCKSTHRFDKIHQKHAWRQKVPQFPILQFLTQQERRFLDLPRNRPILSDLQTTH